MAAIFAVANEIVAHWCRDKMATNLKATIWNPFPCIKLWYLDSNFTEICSQGPNLHQGSIGSDNGLVLNRQQYIIWINDGLIHWCIYATLSLNVFKYIDSLVQDCSNSIANTLELLQSSTKPSTCLHDRIQEMNVTGKIGKGKIKKMKIELPDTQHQLDTKHGKTTQTMTSQRSLDQLLPVDAFKERMTHDVFITTHTRPQALWWVGAQ